MGIPPRPPENLDRDSVRKSLVESGRSPLKKPPPESTLKPKSASPEQSQDDKPKPKGLKYPKILPRKKSPES